MELKLYGVVALAYVAGRIPLDYWPVSAVLMFVAGATVTRILKAGGER